MERRLVFFGDFMDESDYGINVEMEQEDLTIIKKMIKTYEKKTEIQSIDFFILSEIKDKVARCWIELFLSKEQTNTKGDYSELQNQLGKTLEFFNHYTEKLAYMNLLVKLIFILEKYRENVEDTLFYESVDEEDTWLKDNIDNCAIEYIQIDFIGLLREWEYLEGPRLYSEAQGAEDDADAILTELEWWQDNHNWEYFEEHSDSNDLIMVFRAIRNSLVKSIRHNEPVLSSDKWMTKIEIL